MRVSIWPGATALTVKPFGASSTASARTETDNARLARAVCARVRLAVQPGDRGGGEQPAAARHRQGGLLERVHHTEQVHAQDALPGAEVTLEEGLHERDARVGHADVELAGARDCLRQLLGVGHVRHHAAVRGVGVHADHLGALGPEARHRGRADAGGRARHERAPSLESSHEATTIPRAVRCGRGPFTSHPDNPSIVGCGDGRAWKLGAVRAGQGSPPCSPRPRLSGRSRCSPGGPTSSARARSRCWACACWWPLSC